MQKEFEKDFSVINVEMPWFIGSDGNSLFIFNEERKKLELETIIDPTENNGHLYGNLHQENNLLYIFPVLANNIVIYDVETKKSRKVNLPSENNKKEKFSNVFFGKKFAWLIPMHTFNYIYVFDWLSCEFSSISIEMLNRFWNFDDYIWGKGIQIKNEIWVPCRQENFVLHVKEGVPDIIFISCKHVKGFYSMTHDGTNFWMIPVQGNYLVKWGAREDLVEEIELNKDRGDKYLYVDLIYVNHQIWLIPYNANQFCVFDSDNKNRMNYYIDEELADIIKRDSHLFYYAEVKDNIIRLYPWKLSVIVEIDTTLREINTEKMYKIDHNIKWKESVYSEAALESGLYQKSYVQLKYFINEIINRNKFSYEEGTSILESKRNEGYGSKIFHWLETQKNE